jgi:hypothetical protein
MWKEYLVLLAIPWLANLCAFLWTASLKLRQLGTEPLSPAVETYLAQTAMAWLVFSSSGAFANMLFQKWRNKRKRKAF